MLFDICSNNNVSKVLKITLDKAMKQGKQIYQQKCMACHQSNGEGLPGIFPALKGTKIAVGPIQNHIEILLKGVQGTAMQSFTEQLNDEEIALVVSYERQAWGNADKEKYGDHAGGIAQSIDVAKLRKSIK